MDRKKFIQTSGILFAGSIITKSAVGKVNFSHKIENGEKTYPPADFPLIDLHVHRSKQQSIDDLVAKSKKTGIKFGVMENVAPWGIRDNEQLKTYIDTIKPYPVYIGLQPMSTGWSKNLSPELIAQADYVSMDPQVVPDGNGYGETINVWEYASYIDDPEAFMQRNMQYYLTILTGDEPLNIFACPLFLPISIQKEYYRLWTKKRLQQIIDATKARNIAIEINDLVRVPHEEFIIMAKRAGLKFTFGSDTRDQKTGRLDYCKYIAVKCGLTKNDFYIPERKIS
ncbi:MAG TPA: hypothetical protein PK816_09010 [Candidatus Cloacimonadota bacterium]|jgi:hypothetical protein|nr:hypothetical protein [Bacteroidales bacterium]HPM02281.1 hypothetical protein [Candidatus Cloacimonadota bacterium]HQM69505.1 hypothetical protein [Bacteroidales bacterium]